MLPASVYAWRAPEGNVGDDANLWLAPKLFGDDFDQTSDTLVLFIGSILDEARDTLFANHPRRIVFGAGVRSSDTLPDMTLPGWDLRFVRGPKSAEALAKVGVETRGIADPAVVAPLFHTPSTTAVPGRIGFVPHWTTDARYAACLAATAGVDLVPPTLAPEAFFDRLATCERVVCEAMHGAIFADAFGIPWAPCRISNWKLETATHHFKWADWASSLDLTLDFHELPYLRRKHAKIRLLGPLAVRAAALLAGAKLRRALKTATWSLSDRDLLARRQQEILSAAQDLAKDLRAA